MSMRREGGGRQGSAAAAAAAAAVEAVAGGELGILSVAYCSIGLPALAGLFCVFNGKGLFCVTGSLFGHASTLKVIGLFCVYTRSLLDSMPGANSANAEADAKQSVIKVGVDNRGRKVLIGSEGEPDICGEMCLLV
jgi:hypothetical protein